MANLVERATSDMLIGPDWAKNLEICDAVNSDPTRAKEVIRAVKKRMGSKNPRVQLLALTVLETMVKNCGEVVHQQVVERDVLHEMLKIAKKQKDQQVKEKILVLLDVWQEAFGGRYPQYVMACDDLQRSGLRFPKRNGNAAPIFTPPQTQPIARYSPSPERSPNYMSSRAETSTIADLPVLSLAEMQTARSVTEVLMDMLNAIDPRNRQALRDEVIMDLVEQCQVAKRRVMQLVSSTSDEDLLGKGLALNDDLQRVLAKHDALASGASLEKHHNSAVPPVQLINVDEKQNETNDNSTQSDYRSVSSLQPQNQSQVKGALQTLLPPPQSERVAAPATKHEQTIDLLSGDTYKDKSENSTSLVPVSMQYSHSSASLPQQNALIPYGSDSASQGASSTSFYNASSQLQGQQRVLGQNGIRQQLLSQQSEYQQFQHHMQVPGQSYLQGQGLNQIHDTSYVVPWAQPGSQSLSGQQQTLLYGSDASVSSLHTPNQFSAAYNSQLSPSQSVAPEAYNAQLQPHGAYGAFSVPSQQNFNLPQQPLQNLSIQQLQPEQNPSIPQQQNHSPHLPAPPWSMETPEVLPVQQAPLQYEYGMMPPISMPGLQSPQKQQFQQPPQMFGGQFSPYFIQTDLADRMQNISVQSGSYYIPGQSMGHYNQQVEHPSFQRQVHSLKQEKPEDKLFKDLVDLAKSKNDGVSRK